jgi:hypothetical protein
MSVLTLLAGLVVIIAAIYAILRKVDARLALLLGALALGALSRQPMLIVRTFVSTFSSEQFLVPIGTAVGFGYVLRFTGCEQHLVQLLVRPLRRVHWLLVPGVVLVGFAMNCPVISQVGTAVSIGAVLVPLLRAARVPAVTSGAALLLGCSLGGDLLNPGAPEWRTVAEKLTISANDCVARVLPLLLVQVAVVTALFWVLTLRADRTDPKAALLATAGELDHGTFQINYLKAVIPLVPLILLFLTGPPLQIIPVPNPMANSGRPPAGICHTLRFRNGNDSGTVQLLCGTGADAEHRSETGRRRGGHRGLGRAHHVAGRRRGHHVLNNDRDRTAGARSARGAAFARGIGRGGDRGGTAAELIETVLPRPVGVGRVPQP